MVFTLFERVAPCWTRTAVLGLDLVGMVITALAYASATPTRYFTSQVEAVDWLLLR